MNRYKPLCLSVLLGLSYSGLAAAAGRPDLVSADLARGLPHTSGELLVQWMPEVSADARLQALTAVGGVVERTLKTSAARRDGRGDLQLLRVPTALPIEEAMRRLEAEKSVDFAEPNWVYQHTAVSNDPYFTNGSLWGMYGTTGSPTNAYGSRAADAWAGGNTCSSSVYVAVIDEGFMDTHEDLAANAWTNPYDPVDGVDNDGNGFIDDVHGWDFAGDDNSTFDGVSDDHGTHVSGTIGGVGGNGIGVAGVCWQVRLISAKFLGRTGGTTADAIAAVDYVTDLKLRHAMNIVATNNSWGGGGFSQGLYDAIDAGAQADILFVAAAGNDSVDNDSSPHYPSSYDLPGIISVASITSTGALSSFSNWGASTVDLGAPGSDIWSTLPARKRFNVVSSYGSYSGTSMATPHVTGAVAMYASSHPGTSALDIKSAIMGATIATPSLSAKTVTGGRLNVSGF